MDEGTVSVRITELSERSGLSIPTIKYYRREGLLPPGRTVGPNRVDYDRRHLSRLRLIRQLVDIAGLTLPAVRALLAILDDPAHTPFQVLATAAGTRGRGRRACPREETWRLARDRMAGLLAKNGWRVRRDAAALDEAADVLSALQGPGQDLPAELLIGYIRLARATVAEEMRLAQLTPFQPHMTIFYDQFFAALRRLAREDWGLRHGLSTTVPAQTGAIESGCGLPSDDPRDHREATPPARAVT